MQLKEIELKIRDKQNLFLVSLFYDLDDRPVRYVLKGILRGQQMEPTLAERARGFKFTQLLVKGKMNHAK